MEFKKHSSDKYSKYNKSYVRTGVNVPLGDSLVMLLNTPINALKDIIDQRGCKKKISKHLLESGDVIVFNEIHSCYCTNHSTFFMISI